MELMARPAWQTAVAPVPGEELHEAGSLGRPWEGGRDASGARMSPRPSPRPGQGVPGQGLDKGWRVLQGGHSGSLGRRTPACHGYVTPLCLGSSSVEGSLIFLLWRVDEQIPGRQQRGRPQPRPRSQLRRKRAKVKATGRARHA